MKKIQQLSLLLVVIFAFGCEPGPIGPTGSTGPPGPQGDPGVAGEIGIVFEFTNVDFVAPDYEVFLNYPDGFEGLESDVSLVYLLWDTTTDSNGDPLDIWRQIPQSLLTANGLLIYNFDFSRVDVRLFLAAEFSLDQLESIDTDDWIARVVVVPGDFWGGRSGVDQSDYYAVQEAYGLPELPAHADVVSRRPH